VRVNHLNFSNHLNTVFISGQLLRRSEPAIATDSSAPRGDFG
jgi:hypothetical protein